MFTWKMPIVSPCSSRCHERNSQKAFVFCLYYINTVADDKPAAVSVRNSHEMDTFKEGRGGGGQEASA